MVINEASNASMTLQETTGERGLTIFGAEIAVYSPHHPFKLWIFSIGSGSGKMLRTTASIPCVRY